MSTSSKAALTAIVVRGTVAERIAAQAVGVAAAIAYARAEMSEIEVQAQYAQFSATGQSRPWWKGWMQGLREHHFHAFEEGLSS